MDLSGGSTSPSSLSGVDLNNSTSKTKHSKGMIFKDGRTLRAVKVFICRAIFQCQKPPSAHERLA